MKYLIIFLMVLIFGIGLGALSQTNFPCNWTTLLGFFGGLIYYRVSEMLINSEDKK